MCRLCAAHPVLSRRSFGRGLVSAAAIPALPACLSDPPDAVIEAFMRMATPPEAPRTVALTLDCCSGAVDMRILDVLVALSVPATLFVTGLWLHGNAPALARLRGRPDLFSLQNHGALHLPPVLGARHVYGLPVAGTLDAVKHEVARGGALIVQAGAPAPRWYRGAAGLYSRQAMETIVAMDYAIGAYSLNADEGASLPAASVARRIAAARSGDVIVAHMNQPHRPSGEGVALGVAALHRDGTRFVGLDAFSMTDPVCRVHPMGHQPAETAPLA